MIKHLGIRIESLRCNAGLDRAVFARQLGMSQTGLEQLEAGQLTDITVVQIAKTADALGVTLVDLFADVVSDANIGEYGRDIWKRRITNWELLILPRIISVS